MNSRQFLETVWPPLGPYCIATPWIRPDGEKVYAHRAFDTIDDVLTFVLQNRNTDVYFATHAIKIARTLNPKTGKQQTFRTHENMREARVFFFDLDSGEHYTTQDDILNALEQFLFRTCLPSPIIVSSGYGIHVYWPVTTPMDSLSWREPAARLYWLAQQHGLHVDPSRTTDQSSVLRVPSTTNTKNPEDLRRITIVAEGVANDDFLNRLNALTVNYTWTATASCPKQSASVHGANLTVAWDGRSPDAVEVADVCEHIRTFRDSGGNIPEPAWHAGIGTLKYCADGATAAHQWSSGHPEYSHGETQGKLEAWVTPPPGCEKLDRNSGNPTICARCPHKDTAKNPLLIANVIWELAHQPPPPVPTPPAMTLVASITPPCLPPAPYELDMTRGVKDTKNGWVCRQPLFPLYWVDPTANESCRSIWATKPPLTDWVQFEVKNDELEIGAIAPALRNKGIVLGSKQVKHVQAYMLAYLQELHRHQTALEQHDFVGWKPQNKDGFGVPEWFILHGRKIAIADGSVARCEMTPATPTFGMSSKGGTMQAQITAMQFHRDRAYMAHQFALACSLATPFYRFSTLHGAIVCLTGDTGTSKSTAAYLAASLWGHPKLYATSALQSASTYKARQERSAVQRNLPSIVDEMTKLEPGEAYEIALAVSQPGSFEALKSNREFRDPRGGYQSKLVICTSNKSLVHLINAGSPGGHAGIMRIFEMNIMRNEVHTKTEADDVMRHIEENYGWIGEDFLCKCLPHTPAIAAKFIEIQQKLEADIKVSPEERFMTSVATTGLLGVKLGNSLGYFTFNYKQMREWLIDEQIPSMRSIVSSEREQMSPESVVSDYLETIRHNTYRAKKNVQGKQEVIYTPTVVETKARYDITKGLFYVRIDPFKKYCAYHNLDYSNIIDQLVRIGAVIYRSIRKRMHPDGRDGGNPVFCFIMKITGGIKVPDVPEGDPPAPIGEDLVPDRKVVDFSEYKNR